MGVWPWHLVLAVCMEKLPGVGLLTLPLQHYF